MSVAGIRAVRNNNPGNIEKGPSKWQGLAKPEEMTPVQQAEKRFLVFKSPKYGFRAMAVTLITYQDSKHHAKDGSRIDTIREAIERWAPDFENNVEAYVKSVDKNHPKAADEEFDFHVYEDAFPLIKAMSRHECGSWMFKDADLKEGLRLAGVEAPLAPLHQDRIVQASTLGAPLLGTGLLADLFNGDVSNLVDTYQQISYYWPKIALVCAAGVVGYIVWRHLRDRKRGGR